MKEVKERRPATDDSEDPPAKITRLAIGVEGGFEDKDNFEYQVSAQHHTIIIPLLYSTFKL